MTKYYYDLHIHSCLSPCGDDDMTPANIAGMATLGGLQLVALTDHNSARNCPAFFEACRCHGIVPIAGMELTTAEDIHIVCLFRTLEEALSCDEALQQYRIRYKNRVDIYGQQMIMDSGDNIIGVEDDLLSNATTLSLDDAVCFAREHGAYVYPAHIDREANGIISILGTVPEECGFTCVEFRNKDNVQPYIEKYGLEDKRVLISSDAHYLWDINEAHNFVEIDDEPYSSNLVRNRFFEYLEGKR